MKNVSILTLFILLFFSACENPDPTVAPEHITRVPRPVNLRYTKDHNANGTFRLTLAWDVADTVNLKDFAIQRRDLETDFAQLAIMRTFTYEDTIVWAIEFPAGETDSVKAVAYTIVPFGLDRYTGQASDTLWIPLNKNNP